MAMLRWPLLVPCLVLLTPSAHACTEDIDATVTCAASAAYHECLSGYYPETDQAPPTSFEPAVCVCLTGPLRCMLRDNLCDARAMCQKTALLYHCDDMWCGAERQVKPSVYEAAYTFTGAYAHTPLREALRARLGRVVPAEWLAFAGLVDGTLVATVTIPAGTPWHTKWEAMMAGVLNEVVDDAALQASSGVERVRVRFYVPEEN